MERLGEMFTLNLMDIEYANIPLRVQYEKRTEERQKQVSRWLDETSSSDMPIIFVNPTQGTYDYISRQ